ncbi:MAG: iron ABC transporter permease [Chthoniobacterales bacterium]
MSKATWFLWNRRPLFLLVFLFFLALVAMGFSASRGAVHISLREEVATVLAHVGIGHPVDSQTASVFWNIRLPRVLMGFLVGGILAVSGTCLQGLFRNPLADPGLIGISSGAALAAVAVIVFGSSVLSLNFRQEWGFAILPVAAFGGALGATFLIYQFATIGGEVRVAALLLAGIAINALAGAGIGWMSYLATEDQLRMLTFWGMGSLGSSNWMQLKIAGPIMLAMMAVTPLLAGGLNALSLGEADARHLGFSVTRLKQAVVILSALGVGAAVSVSGVIGFLGLVAPHLLRLMIGSNHRWVIPGSIILGGGLLTLADLLARTLVVPAELPIGIVVSSVGAPFFLYLMVKEKKRLLS